MKYEAVFGDQSLFDFAHKAATHATAGRGFYKVNADGLIEYLSDGILNGNKNETLNDYLIAERRIIRTPTWTVADQKAGKLPEVGCVVATIPTFNCVVVGIDEERKRIAIQYENGKLDVVSVDCIHPIESQEEKAARLREDWCAKAAKTLKNLEYNSTLTSIYDALLSGDLPVPVKDGE